MKLDAVASCRCLNPLHGHGLAASWRSAIAFRDCKCVGSRDDVDIGAQSHGLFTRCLWGERELVEFDVNTGQKRLLGTVPPGEVDLAAPSEGHWFAVHAVEWNDKREPSHVLRIHGYPSGKLLAENTQCHGILGRWRDRGLFCGGVPAIFDVEKLSYHPGKVAMGTELDHISNGRLWI